MAEGRGQRDGQRLIEPHGCPPAQLTACFRPSHDCLLPRGLKCHWNATSTDDNMRTGGAKWNKERGD